MKSIKPIKYLSDYPSMDELLFNENSFKFSKGRLIAGKNANNPVVDVGNDNITWFAWSEKDNSGDVIKILMYNNEKLLGPVQVSEIRGIEFQPSLAAGSKNKLWIVWSAFRNNKWKILLKEYDGLNVVKEEPVCENTTGLFNPKIIFNKNNLYIAWEKVENNNTVISFKSYIKGTWSEEKQISKMGNYFSKPSLLCKNGEVWSSYNSFDKTSFNIILQKLIPNIDEPVTVTDSIFQEYEPSLACDNNGLIWIAGATNYAGSAKNPWPLTRWIFLRSYDGNKFLEPIGVQQDKNLHRPDFYQGWEFPSITIDKNNTIWIFGQSSHTLYFQYYSGNKWSKLYNFSERHWGSWKQGCTSALGPDGRLRLVAMGLQGMQFHLLTPTISEKPKPLVKKAYKRKLNVIKDYSKIYPEPRKPQYPTILDINKEKMEVYFGDIHAHSVYSDGVGDADEFYLRNRYYYKDDFASLTDHDYLDGIELSYSTFEWMCNLANRFNTPNEFVTFCSYEWTPPAIAFHSEQGQKVGEGHKNVYYSGNKGPLYSYGDKDTNTGMKLLKKLRKSMGTKDVIVIPHHIGWSNCNWEGHDEKLQPLIEICSTHGRYEYEGNTPIGYRKDQVIPGKFVQDMLNKGFKLGFTGGSDSHGLIWHGIFPRQGYGDAIPSSAVGWKKNAFRTGLTAIIAPELTRKSLFESLKRRRCYATSGAKIFLDFRIENHLMGSDIKVNKNPLIFVKVIGTNGLRSIDIVRDGHIMASYISPNINNELKNISFSIKDNNITRQSNHYYYLRVLQEDGEMAWSSPIWVCCLT